MTYISDKRLCVNADKSAIVDCESPEAAYQLAPEGGEVSAADVKKYGLNAKAEAKAEADDKADAPEEKAVEAPAENKAKTGAAKK